MFSNLLIFHSIFRWLVLISLLYSIGRSVYGYQKRGKFNKLDNAIRHWTATITHIQFAIGIILYTQSPIVKYLFTGTATGMTDSLFFGLIHISLMLASVVMVTIGSAVAKRKTNDKEKFSTILYWFSFALLLIIMAIPWPFSPLAQRPYLRY